MLALRIAVVGVALLVVALAVAYAYFVRAPSPTAPRLSGQSDHAKIRVGSRDRTFSRYVPARMKPGAALLLALHGTGQTGQQLREWTGFGFDLAADQGGFMVLYPDGYRAAWNDCRKSQLTATKKEDFDDMGFLRALVEMAQREHGIDPARVHAFGYSNGGQMAYRLVNEAPALLAGFATVSAYSVAADDSICLQTTPTPPFMLVAGTGDTIVPLGGGMTSIFGRKRGVVLSAQATIDEFLRRNGITAAPKEGSPAASIRSQVWEKEGRPYVAFYTVAGGGHTVPQSAFRFPRIMGATSTELETPAQVVSFFGLGG